MKKPLDRRLKIALVTANLTNNEVADRLGVSRATASAWIRGERTVPTKYLRDLAALLNLSVEELLPR